MSIDTNALKRTKLYNKHIGLGAKMVPFAGFDMPVQYEGLTPEHHAVRNSYEPFMGKKTLIRNATNSEFFKRHTIFVTQ